MKKNEIFTLWISEKTEDTLPMLAHLSLKSMLLCGHDVILYTYSHLNNIPKGVRIVDANDIIHHSKIFRYKSGHKTLSGFANLFRLKRLYELGGTWLDLDILLIRNINDKFDEDVLICSEPTKVFYSKPNNAVIRFPSKDPFVKSMLDYAEKRGDDVIHGETGPTLVLKTLKKFYTYNQYLKPFNFNNLLNWKYLDDYSKSPSDLLSDVDMDEIIGFHFVNTFFDKLFKTNNPKGLFNILKRIILNSNSSEEYEFYLKKYNILRENKNNKFANYDLKYLDIITTKLNKKFKYTILIDSKNLKKVEIYNILHSMGYDSSFDDLMKATDDTLSDKQVIIFGKTNIPIDKIKFKDNIIFLSSNIENIDFQKHILGEYVIPINKPIIFTPGFFKDLKIKTEIEQYLTNNPDTKINMFDKNVFNIIYQKYGMKNIFNLNKKMLSEFELKVFEKVYIFDYETRSNEAKKLMELVDTLYKSKNKNIFLKIKTDLKELKFRNIIDEVSYNYYMAYENILSSKNYDEFRLKEENTQLCCLNSFYLNKINPQNEP